MTALDWVAWIAMGAMFCAFLGEVITSYFLRRDGFYEPKDTLVNLAVALGYTVASLGYGAIIVVILLPLWKLTPLRWSMDTWWHWTALFVINDFCFYWSHRASHTVRFMWASHAVHHNSPKLNLSTGMRNSWVGGAMDWVFFAPVVALGFHPAYLFAIVPIASGWDYMCHTPYIGKLPGMDFIFNTPSNHRVHHATNASYLDRNLGGMLIIWDRMFGTYAAETEQPKIGALEMPARPHNPVHVQFYLWVALFRDAFRKRRPTTT
jgi:sterol desaturase/sphingolipid hydroxylase (fatty acid hydroxylase superfamily)